jgi:uncharacterized protein (DUF4415 family)
MPKLKHGTIVPDLKEDVAIDAAIAGDSDTRELDREWFKTARSAKEALPELVGQENAAALVKRRGRPASESRKVATSIRLDSDLLDAFKSTGEGWQTRMNDALRSWAKKHDILPR